MSQKKPQKPLVNSVASQLKRTIQPVIDTNPATPEETKQRKNKLLTILDKSADVFLEAVSKGQEDIKTSADLERIVKLTLLLSGEADTIQGKSATKETVEGVAATAQVSMSKVEQILDPNDPDVKNIFNKLFEGYNAMNDAVDDE